MLADEQVSKQISEQVDKYTKQYGRQYYKLIREALVFLSEHEPSWLLDTPIDKDTYINKLVKLASPASEFLVDILNK